MTSIKQKFLPFDIVRNKKGEIGFITDSNFNKCQDQPIRQFSYSIEFLTENKTRSHRAWYNDEELEWTGKNFLELLSKNIGHPFNQSNVLIDLKDQRRPNE